MINLSALEAEPVQFAPAGEGGKPLDLPLENVHEDPDQPRTEFDADELKRLADSIKDRGVKTPVSVRPYPGKPDHYILNYGGRRYRASSMAGKTTIPAFVDEQHDTFDQVVENTHRDPLKPMELALFFKAQSAAKVSKSIIAGRLGIDNATISYHLALLDLPDSLEAVYRNGRCTSARTLYELRKLHDKHAEQVEKWLKGKGDITRGTVAALSDRLRTKTKPKSAAKQTPKSLRSSPSIAVSIGSNKHGSLILDRQPDEGMAWVNVDGESLQVACADIRLESVRIA